MEKYCIYLRKSRADEEMERVLGEGTTLNKHKKALLKYAKDNNLNVVQIHEEVESADSIINRPKMVILLQEVETKTYDGVLVMDIQRLGRGDTEDQGIIMRIFKESHTKILTPQKIYNLDDDYDEDYFEFESFMGRKEYKMIKKRMQAGRINSLEDGNYIATNPPYGYDIKCDKKTRTLVANDQADIVRMIFDLYTNGIGTGTIVKQLNDLGYPSPFGKEFSRSTIAFILKNPVYIGMLTWKKREYKKSRAEYKKKDVRTRSKDEWIVAKGKHEGIIDEETFLKAQEILSGRQVSCSTVKRPIAGVLSGLVKCGMCGGSMVRRPYYNKAAHLICYSACGNKSARYDLVEERFMELIDEYTEKLELQLKENKSEKDHIITGYKNQIKKAQAEIEKLNLQRGNLYDLLEQGVYTTETFTERNESISARLDIHNNSILELQNKIDNQSTKDIIKKDIKKIKSVLQLYNATDDLRKKNLLLKSIVEKAIYLKKKKQYNGSFTLSIVPRINI